MDQLDKLISKYAGLVVLAVALCFLLKGDLFCWDLWLLSLQILSLCLVIYSRLQFGTQQFRPVAEPGTAPLIIRGPYRVIRHPVYAGVLLFLLLSVLGHVSFLNAAVWSVALLVVLRRISIEEQFLRRRYPEHPEYQRQTQRLIPFVF